MDTLATPMLLGLLVLVTAVVSFVWLCALIDCLRSEFRHSGDKIGWLLALMFLPVLLF